MPQEFHVVRCFKCEAFQVHIVKKVPKWECKICGEKQSVRQVYGKGTGKDCRIHVQKLNSLRADEIPNDIEELGFGDEKFDTNPSNMNVHATDSSPKNELKKSKWTKFLDEEFESNSDDSIEEQISPPLKKHRVLDSDNCTNSYATCRNQNEINLRQTNQKSIYSYFNLDKTISQKFLENEAPIQSEDCIENLTSSNSQISSHKVRTESILHKSNDQLLKKTVFESFKDNDNLDSILDTNF